MKNGVLLMLPLLLLSSPACDQAPQDSHSGKAPTGMIDPGPGAPSAKRAFSPEPAAASGTTGVGGGAWAGAGGNGGAGGTGAPAK